MAADETPFTPDTSGSPTSLPSADSTPLVGRRWLLTSAALSAVAVGVAAGATVLARSTGAAGSDRLREEAAPTQIPRGQQVTQIPVAAPTQIPRGAQVTQIPVAAPTQIPRGAQVTQIPVAAPTQIPRGAQVTQIPVAAPPTQIPLGREDSTS